MLILGESDLGTLLKIGEVIEAVERGFLALAEGAADVPARLHLSMPESKAVLLEMPAYIRASQAASESALGTKIVSVFEGNRELGLNIVQSAYLLLDSSTGAPLALIEGRFITGIRTAAASAVATKYMTSQKVTRLAVFGAGVQARFHIEAMLEVAKIERVLIASRTSSKANELARYVSSNFSTACDVVSSYEAAQSSNLICTCTSSPDPVFDGSLIRPGTHINAVGAFTPSTRELDSELIRRSRVIIDAETSAGREAGEILIPLKEGSIQKDHVAGTLADVVSGKVIARRSEDEITLFKSCGLAIEDLVTAQLAYKKAKANSVGLEVTL